MNDPEPDGSGLVAGVFQDQATATDAVQRLIDVHFEPGDISVVLTDEWTLEPEGVPINDELKIIEGARLGGTIGAVIGALGAGMAAAGLIAGPAALIAAGPVTAALEGALAVGADDGRGGAMRSRRFEETRPSAWSVSEP